MSCQDTPLHTSHVHAHCTHTQVQTRLQYRAGLLTWLVCCGICWIAAAFGLIFGIVGIVAFFIDDLKDVYHLDPNGNVVGVYKRI